ncbi:hypothetical protein CLAFUW4_02289 [Fulvia fulva]|uniref:Zn(2)-C6 fungal-type domain-containing protein n=1 Tax=Passalora fulva TaxID=5499 RepID=A0A9Q8L7M6_PASFU|nr:uncharacterized protein CLAFUR5_02278 [Fulvia fulva]KAK4635868.1 hypothetical protein CLAFUR4_02284 [Fulvia fulva]KAK4638496.1 hypothetical protein CLAFUR0_02288 [Fulvia fulva]UJO12348.1 hypothetical protein CLAFUR5_02278 [Fulvia fulva]WPV10403.1 hypothetical protein CLAFUW4_02289 [Fulvia fulva]WPV24511.1 hypothetical protein CLAFUW7_02289 [Fulvia fulva]
MDQPAEEASPPAKKRRIPKACSACRRSKLRCDENRPCSRCVSTGVDCVYIERPKDPIAERFERLESTISYLQGRLDSAHGQTSPAASYVSGPSQADTAPTQQRSSFSVPGTFTGLSSFAIRHPPTLDLVAAGVVSVQDARYWFETFFLGCDRFIPAFDPAFDTYDSVRTRSNVLFDAIVTYGCRAATGVLSKQYQALSSLLRRRTSDLVLLMSQVSHAMPRMEDIQALLVIASFSESGAVLSDVALKAAVNAGLPDRLDDLFAMTIANNQDRAGDIAMLFRQARVWFAVFVLDQILSLDGGKPPSVYIRSSPRRIRALISHSQRTTTDLRLFAQVELNAIRSSFYSSVASGSPGATDQVQISQTMAGSLLDLRMWLSEWHAIELNDTTMTTEHPVMLLNLQIQHAWAVLTLHLPALTASGVENIAFMTDAQRNIAVAAKAASEHHLQLLLTNVEMPGNVSTKPYVANLKYAMEFVWAKNAFSVLIVLRLGILLGDHIDTLALRLSEARAFLAELDKAGMGTNISYIRILLQTVEKCERAIRRCARHGQARESTESSDIDFQSFVPKEFTLEWDFPGLNLCYIPFDWQDLFLDFGATA